MHEGYFQVKRTLIINERRQGRHENYTKQNIKVRNVFKFVINLIFLNRSVNTYVSVKYTCNL